MMKFCFLILLLPISLFGQANKDRFLDVVKVQWLDDGRSMSLLNEFCYIDPNGKKWVVPKKTIVDGASIPQILWTTIGGPYEGRYRNASVVHDHYCVTKSEPWEEVHRMFYNACITGGTTMVKAKIMYAAVYSGGPRWEIHMQKNMNGSKSKYAIDKEATLSHDQLEKINKWIESTNPPLDEIKSKLDEIVVEDYKK